MTTTAQLLQTAKARRLPTPAEAKAIREGAGITQQEMANAIPTHRVTLARWEAGTQAPTGRLRAKYGALLAELRALAEAS